ncbi:hypothetical protein GCM10027169_38630 [Gordonia jinhuaensis]|uniref:DUF2316 family protein n=1 Tax=Gordonia jinhuaensis TaxID=1517702 RepID=A0A916SZ72_9ACTN|nr:DUF2316 family protein [Gordonia jinhuaensis]GGB23929.1 hypothetical protein GCM10011489_10260 [Gordonia jinhuaensis]
MSLNARERHRTSDELGANLVISGLTTEELRQRLGFTTGQLDAAMAARTSDPAEVWLVRDYLESVIARRGATPFPYSVLTEDARRMAQIWFDLATPPPPEP